nr:substrate-binding domain-containing protein [Amycolatopsis kentuckyensis]
MLDEFAALELHLPPWRVDADSGRLPPNPASSSATALMASDSLIGLAIVGALQEHGRRIPENVPVLMYDDQP